MLFLSRARFVAGLALVAGLLAVGSTPAQTKANTKNITFKTFDGVTLQGTFYPNPSGKKDATVILLHEPDLKKGGNIQQEGWADLAAALQADGYAVLLFDFRGFGDSKTIDPDVFYRQKANQDLIRGAGRKQTSLSYKDFGGARYLPYLTNDIAAAKAFLDRQNDQKQCNTSSVIVIGAGESASLGALWMMNETRRAKDKNTSILGGGVPMLGDPESKDLAAGVWLTASPTLGSVTAPWGMMIREVTTNQKVPMTFVYGGGDKKAGEFAKRFSVKSTKDKEGGFPRALAVGGSGNAGHRLLGKGEESEKLILEALRGIMERRGSREWTERKVETSQFFYTQPKSKVALKINKKPGEEVPSVDLRMFLQGY